MRKRVTIFLTFVSLSLVAAGWTARAETTMPQNEPVIEVVTLKLKEGVSFSTFAPIDKAVEIQHVSQQPGFISRQSAGGDNGEWLVIVHWDSTRNAEASMSTFMQAPAAKIFMDHIDASTMVMKRYTPAGKN